MLRILIIDDVETNRFVLRNIIADMGHQPVLAENGVQDAILGVAGNQQ